MKSWDDLNSIERSRVMDLVNTIDSLVKLGGGLTLEDLVRELTLDIKDEAIAAQIIVNKRVL